MYMYVADLESSGGGIGEVGSELLDIASERGEGERGMVRGGWGA